MKKIISLALACVLAFAVMLPCVAAGRTSDAERGAPAIGSVLTIGSWPQTRVTSRVICFLLESRMTAVPNWQNDTLPDGTAVQYFDVYYDAVGAVYPTPTYRAVRIGSETQWYRWEPLEWIAVEYQGCQAMLCKSVVFTAQNDESSVLAWLQSTFYLTAFTAEQRDTFHGVGMPPYGLTKNAAALVGDYAALYGADATNYYQINDYYDPDDLVFELIPEDSFKPEERSACACEAVPTGSGRPTLSAQDTDAKTEKREKAASGSEKGSPKTVLTIGVRPILVLRSQVDEKACGIIRCILNWLTGHRH